MADKQRKPATPRRSKAALAASAAAVAHPLADAATPAPHSLADQPAANADRGEHELTLAGVTYRLRPSHAALRAIETKTERSLLALLRMSSVGDLTLDQVGEVASELIRAGADEADLITRHVGAKRISELCLEEGLPRIMARLSICLADAASGGRDAEGNAKAAPSTKTSGGAGAA
jgi:hypothetical protein